MVAYTTIPTVSTFQSDSSKFFALRSSDRTLVQIDSLLEMYWADPPHRPEILYYLYLACNFWLRKVNTPSQNQLPTGMAGGGGALPNTGKVTGVEDRRAAIDALSLIVQQTLSQHHGVNSTGALRQALTDAHVLANNGVIADNAWLSQGRDPQKFLNIHINSDAERRRYKLRFRDHVAYRWGDMLNTAGGYVVYDTTDNNDSETNDQMTHFVMDRRGRIYAGYEKSEKHGKDLVWFKHSSFLGGDEALAAGRLKIVKGTVVLVENDSGHYRPGAAAMIAFLRRLALYGQDLARTQVKRHVGGAMFSAAQMLAAVDAWPDGQNPH